MGTKKFVSTRLESFRKDNKKNLNYILFSNVIPSKLNLDQRFSSFSIPSRKWVSSRDLYPSTHSVSKITVYHLDHCFIRPKYLSNQECFEFRGQVKIQRNQIRRNGGCKKISNFNSVNFYWEIAFKWTVTLSWWNITFFFNIPWSFSWIDAFSLLNSIVKYWPIIVFSFFKINYQNSFGVPKNDVTTFPTDWTILDFYGINSPCSTHCFDCIFVLDMKW